MSLVRVSTNDPNHTYFLSELLRTNGLQAVMLSPTELEVEYDGTPEALRDELVRWQENPVISSDGQPAQTPGSVSLTEMQPEDPENYEEEYVPEREFILAPYWRSARARIAQVLPSFKGTLPPVKRTWQSGEEKLRRAGAWFHEKEERILSGREIEAPERRTREPNVWGSKIRQEWTTVATWLRKYQEETKTYAFAGGVVMAGLIALGLTVAHGGSRSPQPTANSTLVTTHQAALPRSLDVHPAASTLPSAVPARPVVRGESRLTLVPTAQPTTKPESPERPIASAKAPSLAAFGDGDEEEVVTHYHNRSPVAQAAVGGQKPASDGVKHYSDLD